MCVPYTFILHNVYDAATCIYMYIHASLEIVLRQRGNPTSLVVYNSGTLSLSASYSFLHEYLSLPTAVSGMFCLPGYMYFLPNIIALAK